MKESENLVLVTGASGLIGSHLCAILLKKNKRVRILVRQDSNLEKLKQVISYYFPAEKNKSDQLEVAKGDLGDYFSLLEALKDISVVYHCAGLVSFDDANFRELNKTNARGTENLVNACLETKVPLLHHVSSVAVFPDNKEKLITEKLIWKSSSDNSAYAISKYNAEREVWRGREEGLNVIIVNPGLVIGPGCYGEGSGELVIQAKNKFPIFPPGATGVIDVRDVVRAMLILEEEKVFGERFILSAETVSFKMLFTNLNKQFLHKPPAIKTPKTVLLFLSFLEFVFLLPFGFKKRLTKSTIRSACSTKNYSSQKFISLTGFKFIDIKQSIKDTCDFYKELQRSS